MIIGNGTHTYEWVGNWGTLPEGVKLGYTHGVVVDKRERVYVHNMSKDSVIVFDRDGDYIKSWGPEYHGGAHGMLLNEENGTEYLYLTQVDTNNLCVVKTTLDGDVVLRIETPDMPDVYDAERKFLPTDVAVAPNGDIYVSDGYGQHWIHRYDAKGNRLQSWGGKGSEPGRFDCPHGVSIDTRGPEPVVYVADRGNHRIQVFTLDGQFIRIVSDDLDMPCSFYQYRDELYLPDLHSRITILDKNDKLIAHLGESDAYKQQGWPNLPHDQRHAGKFNSPHGICVSTRGDIFLVEWIEDGRITKLVRQ